MLSRYEFANFYKIRVYDAEWKFLKEYEAENLTDMDTTRKIAIRYAIKNDANYIETITYDLSGSKILLEQEDVTLPDV
jgi:hypothetical protein